MGGGAADFLGDEEIYRGLNNTKVKFRSAWKCSFIRIHRIL